MPGWAGGRGRNRPGRAPRRAPPGCQARHATGRLAAAATRRRRGPARRWIGRQGVVSDRAEAVPGRGSGEGGRAGWQAATRGGSGAGHASRQAGGRPGRGTGHGPDELVRTGCGLLALDWSRTGVTCEAGPWILPVTDFHPEILRTQTNTSGPASRSPLRPTPTGTPGPATAVNSSPLPQYGRAARPSTSRGTLVHSGAGPAGQPSWRFSERSRDLRARAGRRSMYRPPSRWSHSCCRQRAKYPAPSTVIGSPRRSKPWTTA